VPYVGIPLYLIFGGRKFRRFVAQKGALTKSFPEVLMQSQKLQWLDDGVLAFQTFLREIQNAQHSIRIETFVLGNDQTGRALVQALIDRARAGVQVHLSLDDMLSFHAPKDLLREFQNAGGHLTKFMPVIHWPFRGRANLRNHRKIAIFDGTRALVGGMNLADEYMGSSPSAKRWKDLSLLVEGQVVDALDEVFRQDWLFATKQTLKASRKADLQIQERGETSLRVVPCGPDSPYDDVYDGLLTRLFRAQERFWIATPYFIPNDVLCNALAMAVRRGVDVRIIVPQRSNHPLSDLTSASFLRDLSSEGVQILQYHPGMLHAKVVLSDDDFVMVGSANFDLRSLFLNFEIVFFLSSRAEVLWIQEWFEKTFKDCKITTEKSSAMRALVESLLRLLAPIF
jgi:cardiolipin synthase